MDLIMIILNEKQGSLLYFLFFHTIFSLELPGLNNQDLIKDYYCYDYIENFMFNHVCN